MANHPSIKPQSLLRQIAHAALPLGKGTIVDPFMGSGSTIAACEAIGLESVGVERVEEYFELALKAVPKLATLKLDTTGPVGEDDDSRPLLALIS